MVSEHPSLGWVAWDTATYAGLLGSRYDWHYWRVREEGLQYSLAVLTFYLSSRSERRLLFVGDTSATGRTVFSSVDNGTNKTKILPTFLKISSFVK